MQVEEVQEGMWVAHPGEDGGAAIVIDYSPPVLVFRLKVMDLPPDDQRCAGLFRTLLQLNASDLVHGAYGLEEDDVILTEALELENLDTNEFQAVVDSFQLALASHLDRLAPYREC
jgi:hypothetical protein